MTTRSVVLRARARRDVDEAVAHYLDHAGTEVVTGFIDALEEAFGHIADNPGSGSPRYGHEVNLPGLRSWPLKACPYLVDAGVWVSVADATDPLSEPSRAFFSEVAAWAVPVAVPGFARLEISCALARRLRNAEQGRGLAAPGCWIPPRLSRSDASAARSRRERRGCQVRIRCPAPNTSFARGPRHSGRRGP